MEFTLLPNDILFIIINNNYKDTKNFKSISHLSETCKLLKNIIPEFKIKQLKLNVLFNKCSKLTNCANANCCSDMNFIENNRYKHYIHYHQEALKSIVVYITNDKFFKTKMPYCFECMKLYSYIKYSNCKYRLIHVEDQALTFTLEGLEILPPKRTLAF